MCAKFYRVNYNPPKNGERYSREEWQEWIDTHRPFFTLPPQYQHKGPPRRGDPRIPLLHFALLFTDTQSFEACKRFYLLYEWETLEKSSHLTVKRLVSHIQATYPFFENIKAARSLSPSPKDYLLSIATNIDLAPYYALDPKLIFQTKEGIQEIFQMKDSFFWYWDVDETPYTGWPATTNPEFEPYLHESFSDDEYESGDPSSGEDEGSETDLDND
ncbi:hypothetical protein C8Q75DRAFT_785499 [Abortiporus biennis]|nr:hypothetical protein C8Q75DRAFT_785499 [Abortiporus biennis]